MSSSKSRSKGSFPLPDDQHDNCEFDLQLDFRYGLGLFHARGKPLAHPR